MRRALLWPPRRWRVADGLLATSWVGADLPCPLEWDEATSAADDSIQATIVSTITEPAKQRKRMDHDLWPAIAREQAFLDSARNGHLVSNGPTIQPYSRQTGGPAVQFKDMNTTAAPETIRELAGRMIWWKEPEETLRYPARLLAQVMALGTWDDVQLARRLWTREEFVAVLREAPPGVFDPRSWVYWHRVLKVEPVPPLPQRQLP